MSGLLDRLRSEIGITHRSDWLLVDQSMIDCFADATLDRQFIHVDPVRAAATPLGGTIAHGFLTLALLAKLHEKLLEAQMQGAKFGLNYGLDRVRFIHPVRSGSRIRAASTLVSVEERKPGQYQQAREVVIEIEGVEKPALIATWLTQMMV